MKSQTKFASVRRCNLETSIGSRKSTHAPDASGNPEKTHITNKVTGKCAPAFPEYTPSMAKTTSFSDSPCIPGSNVSFSRPTEVYRFNLQYSKIILKFEIILFLVVFISLFIAGDYIYLLPGLFFCCLIAFIFFSSYSIITQFPKGLVFEFRTAPDRLIWYDSSGETSFLLQDMDFRITRWFVLLKLVDSSTQLYRVLLQDSFDDTNYYTSFRRHLLLNKRDEEQC